MPSFCSTTTQAAVRTSSDVQKGNNTRIINQSAVFSVTWVSSNATGKPSNRHKTVTLALMPSVRISTSM